MTTKSKNEFTVEIPWHRNALNIDAHRALETLPHDLRIGAVCIRAIDMRTGYIACETHLKCGYSAPRRLAWVRPKANPTIANPYTV